MKWVFPRSQLLETCVWLILALCYIFLDKHLVFNNNFKLLIITGILMIITIIIMISFSLNRTSGNVQGCDPEQSTKNHTISHYLFFFHTLHVYLAKKPTNYKIRGWKWTLHLQDYIRHWTTDSQYLPFLPLKQKGMSQWKVIQGVSWKCAGAPRASFHSSISGSILSLMRLQHFTLSKW